MIDRMDDTELSISFRQARDKRDQIGVLSDLTLTSPFEIATRLDKLGLLDGTGIRPDQFPNRYVAVEPAYGRRRPYKPRGAISNQIDDARGRELFAKGATDEEIADEFGVKLYRIIDWRRKNGLARSRGGDRTKLILPPIDELRAMDLYQEGYDDLAMSEALGVTVRRVQNWRLRMGIKRAKGHSKKKKGEQTKMKEEKAHAAPTTCVPAAPVKIDWNDLPPVMEASDEQPAPLMEVRRFLATISELMTPSAAKGGLVLNGAPVREISDVRISMVDGAICIEIRTEG